MQDILANIAEFMTREGKIFLAAPLSEEDLMHRAIEHEVVM